MICYTTSFYRLGSFLYKTHTFQMPKFCCVTCGSLCIINTSNPLLCQGCIDSYLDTGYTKGLTTRSFWNLSAHIQVQCEISPGQWALFVYDQHLFFFTWHFDFPHRQVQHAAECTWSCMGGFDELLCYLEHECDAHTLDIERDFIHAVKTALTYHFLGRYLQTSSLKRVRAFLVDK